MTIPFIAVCALIAFMALIVFAACKRSHDLSVSMMPQFTDLPPGCSDSDTDPDARTERERKAQLRDEALEDKADAERDEFNQNQT
jgi:hypothetical protein